jgi:Arc/MetJ-type ribon-helix-helix transcriptional regulator
MGKKESTNWNIPVTLALNQAVDHVVKSGQYSSKSEFVRSACRKELESTAERA